MALNMNYKETLRNTQLDAIDTAVGASGFLIIYDGTQPTTVDTAISGQNVLATLALSATAFTAAASGVLTADTISDDASAEGTGTASWGSLTTSASARIVDFTVGTSGTDMIIDNTSITIGQVVSASSFVITAGNL